jgi:hypothetical protein
MVREEMRMLSPRPISTSRKLKRSRMLKANVEMFGIGWKGISSNRLILMLEMISGDWPKIQVI